MDLESVKVDDIVQCDIKGRLFYALVTGKGKRELSVTPLDNRINYHHVNSRQVKAHFRRSRRRTRRTPQLRGEIGV